MKTAYLHVPIDYEIGLGLPKDYEEKDASLVYKIEKSLYGLKQSEWNSKMVLYNWLVRN